MALKRYNGTNEIEQGKFFRTDGTVDIQIGKIFRGDGTVDTQFYSAEYVFFPNDETLIPSNWRKSSNNYGSSSLDVENKLIKFGARSGSDNSHFYCEILIDMTPYKTCYVNVTALSNPGHEAVTLMWRDPTSNGNKIGMSPLTTGVSQWDVSNINQAVKLDISGDYGNSLIISEIIFEE